MGDKYRLVSKKTGKNLGTYGSKAGAENRERQVQYFKHVKEAKKFRNYKEYTKSMYPKQELPPKVPHAIALPGYERVKDGSFNVLRKIKKEGYDPNKEQLRNRIEAHKAVAEKMEHQHGKESQQAVFHRSLVKRWQKELGENSDSIDEAAKANKKKADEEILASNGSSRKEEQRLKGSP